MKRILAFLFAVVVLFAALPVTQTFTCANGTPLSTCDANWTTVVGTIDINNNAARGATALQYNYAAWTGDTMANDQYVETTALGFVGVSTSLPGSAVRGSSSSASAYICITDGTTGYLQLLTSSSAGTTIATGAMAATAGDKILLEASGTLLTCKVNGITVLSGTDATLTGGRAGIVWYGLGATTAIDTWTAGNLSSGAVRRKAIIFQ